MLLRWADKHVLLPRGFARRRIRVFRVPEPSDVGALTPDALDIDEVWSEIVTSEEQGGDDEWVQRAQATWHPKGDTLVMAGRTHPTLKERSTVRSCHMRLSLFPITSHAVTSIMGPVFAPS